MPGPIASLNAALQWDLQDFDRGTRHIEMSFNRILTLGRDMAVAFNQFGLRMTLGITAPMAALAGFTVNAASNLQELQSAFDYTFGSTAGIMNRWAEQTGNAMGRATSEMKQGALAMGQLFKQAAPTEQAAARLSQRFSVLAQDAASFYNTSFDEAIGKIRSGLSGESEPLRDFGVFLTEAAVKAKALELGMIKVGEELTEQGKIMARAVLIQQGLADANGDVERTAGSFANRVRALRANITELAEEIGQRFLPYAERLIGWAQAAVQWISDLPSGVKDAAVAFGLFAAAIGPAILAIGVLAATVLPLFLANMGPVFLVISALINPLGTAVVVLGKLAGEFGLVSAALGGLARVATAFLGPWGLALAAVLVFKDDIIEAFQNIASYAREALGPGLTELLDRVSGLFTDLSVALEDFVNSDLGKAFASLFETIGDVIRILIEIGGAGVVSAFGVVIDLVTMLLENIQGVVQTVSRLLSGDWAGAWEAAGNVVARAATRIANAIRGFMPWLAGALDLISALTGSGEQLSGRATGGIGGAIGFVQSRASYAQGEQSKGAGGMIGFVRNTANKALGPGNDNGENYAIAGSGGAGSGRKGGGARSGPTPEELAARKEEIRLEQALAVARAKGDTDAERSIQRQIDLKAEVAKFERAGLDTAAAKIAAEKNMLELEQARSEAQLRSIEAAEREFDIQLAILRNDFEAIKYLKDKEYLEERVAYWKSRQASASEAERKAAADLADRNRELAAQTARRLADEQELLNLENARLRGDDPAELIAREESIRIRRRAEELRERDNMRPEEAQAKAIQEGAERSRAALTGTFRDTFRSGLQAAMNGDLGGFFKNWIETRAFDALARVLDRLADGLADLVSGGSRGGGGLFGVLKGALGIAGAISGAGGFASVSSAGSAVGNAAARAARSTATLPRFNSGGWGTIKGFPGIDTNTLSLNGNPIARVSSGELLNVQRAAAGSASSAGVQVKVVKGDMFDVIVQQISAGVVSAATPGIAVQGGQLGSEMASAKAARSSRRRVR